MILGSSGTVLRGESVAIKLTSRLLPPYINASWPSKYRYLLKEGSAYLEFLLLPIVEFVSKIPSFLIFDPFSKVFLQTSSSLIPRFQPVSSVPYLCSSIFPASFPHASWCQDSTQSTNLIWIYWVLVNASLTLFMIPWICAQCNTSCIFSLFVSLCGVRDLCNLYRDLLCIPHFCIASMCCAVCCVLCLWVCGCKRGNSVCGCGRVWTLAGVLVGAGVCKPVYIWVFGGVGSASWVCKERAVSSHVHVSCMKWVPTNVFSYTKWTRPPLPWRSGKSGTFFQAVVTGSNLLVDHEQFVLFEIHRPGNCKPTYIYFLDG